MSDPATSSEADVKAVASTLDTFVQQLRSNPEAEPAWTGIESQCRQLADALRTKDGPGSPLKLAIFSKAIPDTP